MTKTVLVVDDERIIREILTSWLEEAGFDTCSAENGIQGLVQLEANHPDLVVTDILMPQMDGYEFCENVRRVSNAPILVLTGLDRAVGREKGMTLGADDYITKPVDQEHFLFRVTTLLSLDGAGDPSEANMLPAPGSSSQVAGEPAPIRLTLNPKY